MSDAAPLLSANWFRVAALRPQLEAQVQVRRVSYRGQVWQVLSRADGSRSCRLNLAAWSLIGRCDGRLTLQRLWDALLADTRDDAPTQDEVLQLLSRLQDAGLLRFDARPDFGPQPTPWRTAAEADERRGPRSGQSLLAFRIPLGHPDALLARLLPPLRGLFTPLAAAVWVAVVLLGLLGAWLNGGVVLAQAQSALNTPRLLAFVWLAYPVVKAIHELAHALAIRHFGGNVPEWGITLLMFTPVPYVDASAATRFDAPAQRAIVSAAGIAVELFLAALALGLALHLQPGALRELAWAVFFIGSVSTLLVNGNPLLRFDGYHLLTDALELPNLASRSAQHWAAWLRARLLRLPTLTPVAPAAGEAPWLWAYAPAALLWQWGICLAIVGWLGRLSWWLGTAMAVYFIGLLLLKPLRQLVRALGSARLGEAEGRRARRRAFGLAAAVALGLFALPLPFSSVVQGVVWLPEPALLRAGTDGFVRSVEVADGAAVQPGQRVFVLDAPSLEVDRARLQARVHELDAERFQALRHDLPRAVALAHELGQAEAELARVEERAAQLEVAAGSAGIAVIDHADDLDGRYVKQGSVLGHVLAPAPTVVRVAIPQEQAALVQGHTQGVTVQLAETPGEAWPAELLRSEGGTARHLPSAALAEASGGRIATDPTDRLKPAQPVVLADVRLAADLGRRAGGRAWVRFDHGPAPLAWQAARRVQQLFLRHFNPAQ